MFRFLKISLLAIGIAASPLLPKIAVADVGSVTGLDIPRYVSVKSSEANVRTGPGKRYPINWVFTRKRMPVQVVAEYDHWRKIRDWEGVEGWVHHTLLSGLRTVMVTAEGGSMILRAPSYEAAPVVKADRTYTGILEGCNNGWCEVEMAGYRGWLHHEKLWGVDLPEAFNQTN